MCGQPSLSRQPFKGKFVLLRAKAKYLFATLNFLQQLAVIGRKQIVVICNSERITFPPLRCRPLWSWGTLWGTGWTPCSSASRHCPCPLISSSAQPGKQFETLRRKIISTHIFDSKLLFQKLCCHASFLTIKNIFKIKILVTKNLRILTLRHCGPCQPSWKLPWCPRATKYFAFFSAKLGIWGFGYSIQFNILFNINVST